MTEKPLIELIDDYLTGRIGSEEKIYLEELAANDPEVFAQLHSAKAAFNFIEHSYYRNVKKKLQDYDRSLEKNEDLPSYKMIRIVIISIIMISICWIISYWYYQPANLVKRFYIPLTEQFQVPGNSDTIVQLKRMADKAFEENNFTETAAALQLIVSQTDHDDQIRAEWNYLLCQLAIHGFTPEWRYMHDEMIDKSNGAVKREAIELKKQLDSWIYRVTFLQFSPEFSSLKPRLI